MPAKLLLLASLLTMFTMTSPAQNASRILTLDGKPAVPGATEQVGLDGAGHPRLVPRPVVEIYPAAASPSTRGTVLISPGGGYKALAVDHEGHDVAHMLNAAGWDAAILLYHVDVDPDTRALALDDAKKALALLQAHGGEFGLSTACIGAMGFSAGGHLTARLAHETAAGGQAPAFLVLLYPAYLEKDGRVLDEVAPINVPVFLYVGDQDHTYYPNSVAYAAACKEKGIRCEYGVAQGVGHGFGLTANLPSGAREWPEKLRAFLGSLDARP